MSNYFVHPTAEISSSAIIGDGCKLWNNVQIRGKARLGKNCILGKNVYIDEGVQIGDNCKIGNNCSVYHGVTLEDGVFLGPHVTTTNDKFPRAINKDGSLKSGDDWQVRRTLIKQGASVGAGTIILPGITIGRFALLGAGSLVSKDVSDFALAYGNPVCVHGRVDEEGTIVEWVVLKNKFPIP